MAAYRPLGQFNQYFLSDGAVNNGGSITFYATDLTTLKDTYSDIGLTVVNTNPVVLDSSGRLSTDVWGSGDYGAVIKDRSGAVIETRNNIQSGSGATSTIPALVNSEFLTNDGSSLIWQAITQVPDPTGYAGDVLYSDGTLSYWGALPITPTPPSPDIVVTSTSFRGGVSSNTSKFFIQTGSDTAPASGASSTSKAITFGTPFTTLLGAYAMVTNTTFNTVGFLAALAVTSKTTNGFVLNINVPAHQGGSGQDANIIGSVTFDWVAFGLITVV